MACPFASAPLGTALSDFARRNSPGRLTISAACANVTLVIPRVAHPSEIPSRTQSVSAFLPGKVSMGAPFLRRISLQGMPPLPASLQLIKKWKGDRPLPSLSPLTLRPVQRTAPIEIALETLFTPSPSRGPLLRLPSPEKLYSAPRSYTSDLLLCTSHWHDT